MNLKAIFPLHVVMLGVCLISATGASADSLRKLVHLSVSSESTYLIEGKPVSRDGLLAAMRTYGSIKGFDLEITASDRAPYDAIGFALARAHEAGVSGVKLNQVDSSAPASSPSTPRR